MTLHPGVYFLEVWGAQGWNSSIQNNDNPEPFPAMGGKGGYSSAILLLLDYTKIFISVGEKGWVFSEPNTNHTGLFGGGGGVDVPKDQNSVHGSFGGGATDIRILENSLYHRVIVAGGGGGASGGSSDQTSPGGDAGGEFGYDGKADNEMYPVYNEHYIAQGGNQTSGGIITTGIVPGNPGSFGKGGNSMNIVNGHHYGGAGGGGWYGGAGGSHRVSGGGGSGFAFTHESIIPKEYKLNHTYWLKRPKVLSGRDYFPNGENGHMGNGAAKITQYIYNFITYYQKRNFMNSISFTIVFFLFYK